MVTRMKILSLSDTIVPFIYSPQIRRRFADVDLILGCGDLAYYYLEYALSSLDVPLFFVRGNHDEIIEYRQEGQRTSPHGGVDLHAKLDNYKGLLLAGVEGSLRYRSGPYQYSQIEMWEKVIRLVPGLLLNRIRYGRFLDIIITHAPPEGIHDKSDYPHRGVRAFRWFIQMFQPGFFVHGHVHVYRPDQQTNTWIGRTQVLNAYGYREFEFPGWPEPNGR